MAQPATTKQTLAWLHTCTPLRKPGLNPQEHGFSFGIYGMDSPHSATLIKPHTDSVLSSSSIVLDHDHAHVSQSRAPPAFHSIPLHPCVFLDMCIIDINNDLRIKIPHGTTTEKFMSSPSFLFSRSSITVPLPLLAIFPSRAAFRLTTVDPPG
jgi:hypothetical protein